MCIVEGRGQLWMACLTLVLKSGLELDWDLMSDLILLARDSHLYFTSNRVTNVYHYVWPFYIGHRDQTFVFMLARS